MGTPKKQKQIQQALDALGWSHLTFADVLYDELYADENDDFKDTDKDEIRKLAQNLKKQLQRESTSEKRLDIYLRVLFEHPAYQALNLDSVLPKHVAHSCLSDELSQRLTQLSSNLDRSSKS
ncbi:elongation factor Ts [Vibrio tapetis]|uniref:Elongation factor Ts n=1 Tax=Vibrio tapetis subsp. tapetis TaxID=1671868 RepID=A0A2N8ZDG0_9VIBR|nr:elongation factor Ts [Vibrio tapetis]SON49926.1 conserved protein of unknown function [Vibrio tapetis subsp. tapetis]